MSLNWMSDNDPADEPLSQSRDSQLRARIDRMEIALRQLVSDLSELRMIAGHQDSHADAAPIDYALLSPRELEIVRLLLQGRRVPQIARSLFLSPNTVRSHLKSVFRKFDVHSQGELIEMLHAGNGQRPQ